MECSYNDSGQKCEISGFLGANFHMERNLILPLIKNLICL